jgi:cytochrome c oxidase subunit 3
MSIKASNLTYNPHQHPFHLVKPSPWPFLVAFSIGNILIHTVFYLHGYDYIIDPILRLLPFSFITFFYGVISWFWDIIIEATFEGRHTLQVQRGLRIGFILFILSEIIFFFSFFWAFFHSSVAPSIWIGAIWPPLGIKPIYPWALPLLNTAILLSSGITVTWAHKALTIEYSPSSRINSFLPRIEVIKALVVTILLGVLFTSIQLYEYKHASFAINDGIYGSVFYILTGFHGLHVLIGTIFLLVCLIRHIFYHFTRDHHIGFEIAIWYWHFVDIVWIFLFIFVYVWGS